MRQLLHGVRYLLQTVIIDPVRDGMLRDTGWPAGLRGVAAVSFALSALLIILTGASSLIRSHLDLIFQPPQQSLPRVAAPILIASLFFATGMLYAALLHVRLAARIPGLVLVVLVVVRAATVDLGPSSAPALIGCLLMIIFAVLRWRRRFGWAEFVIAQLLTTATLSAALISIRIGFGGYAPQLVLSVVVQLAQALSLLAAPFAVAAGAAIAELTGSLAIATADVVGRLGPASRPVPSTGNASPVAVSIVGLLTAGRVAQLIMSHHTAPDSYHLLSLIGGVVTLGLPLLGLALLCRRPAVRDRLDDLSGQTLLEGWRRWALTAAALIAGTALWATLATVVTRAVQWNAAAQLINRIPPAPNIAVGNAIATVVLLTVAALLLRSDGRVRLILVLLACFRGLRIAFQLSGLSATYTGVLITADLLAVVPAVVWLIRGRLTATRLAGVAAVMLITGLYEYRHVITEPITELLALSGALVGLLVGAIWRLLTDNEPANGESPGFPTPARVLLVLANIVFGTTLIALVALQGGISQVDLDSLERLGDAQLGGDLMFSLLVVIIVGLFTRRDPRTGPVLAD